MSMVMNIMPRFEYICYHCTDEGYKIDTFALFANVISKTENSVTYNRYLKFGNLKSEKPVTVSTAEFEKYYVPLTDEIYQQCIEAQKNYNKF